MAVKSGVDTKLPITGGNTDPRNGNEYAVSRLGHSPLLYAIVEIIKELENEYSEAKCLYSSSMSCSSVAGPCDER